MEAMGIMTIEFVYLVATSFLVFSILKFFYVKHEIQRKEREKLICRQDEVIKELHVKIEQRNEQKEKVEMIEKELNKDEIVLNCPNCGAKGQGKVCEFCDTRLI